MIHKGWRVVNKNSINDNDNQKTTQKEPQGLTSR